MRAERYKRIEELYHAALARQPDERVAFLEQACHEDEMLRREVESLLGYDDRAANFIEAKPDDLAAALLAARHKPSLIGRTLNHYRIISLLGVGGMGEVYLAEDIRLARRVALKLLPDHLIRDEQRVKRFMREARAASALNHPNVVTLHDIGQADDRHFIATEFVEGETLRQRLARRRVSLEEALDAAGQVASALDAAHAAGIVHRDIKPENLMLRPDGYVKVVDFGLAKMTGGAVLTLGLSAAETESGLIMGTVNYMSPEQARGLEVDARTDLWSLGVVLYEMLAGCLPFEGETASDVIVSILERQPARLSKHVPSMPDELDELIARALTKEKGGRCQTAKEMLVELNGLKRRHSGKTERPALERTSPGVETQTWIGGTEGTAAKEKKPTHIRPRLVGLVTGIKGHKRGVGLALLCLVFAAALSYFAWFGLFGQDRSPNGSPWRLQAAKIKKLTTTGKVKDACLSPDGKYFAHVLEDGGQQSLLVSLVATPASTTELVPPAKDRYWGVTFSRDGNYVYYVVAQDNKKGVLYRVPIFGKVPPTKLMEYLDTAVNFSPDGKRYAFLRSEPTGENALMIANSDGSGEQRLAERRLPDTFFPSLGGPAWSPDGEKIACPAYVSSESGSKRLSIVEVQGATGDERLITEPIWPWVGKIAWLEGGKALAVTGTPPDSGFSQIWQVSYPDGRAQQLTNDLSNYISVSLSGDSDSLVGVLSERLSDIWTLTPGVTASPSKQITSRTLRYEGLAWTPDGKIVVESDASGNSDLWVMDADGAGARQLTDDIYMDSSPSVTPDGRYVVFSSNRKAGSNIWRIDADGRNAKPLTSGEGEYNPTCSPDGRWVFYTSWSATRSILWKVSIDGGSPMQLTDKNSLNPAVSPDGDNLVCHFNDDRSWRIAIVPVAGGQAVRFVDIPYYPGQVVRWTPDGSALTYLDSKDGGFNIYSLPLGGGPPKALTGFKGEQIFFFDWSRDGKQIACLRGTKIRDAILITGLKK